MLDSDLRLSIETPLGVDALLLKAFHGHEQMSRLFEFELELSSTESDLDPTIVVGKPITFGVHHGAVTRPFGGIVSRFVSCGQDSIGARRYRARVVPWLWLLTKRSNYRIFQKKTVLEIVEDVFSHAGAKKGTAYESASVRGEYLPREYCVQFGETDFDFVSRLLEAEGIFYFFRFEEAQHVLVLADNAAAYRNLDQNEIEFHENVPSSEQVSSWEHGFEFVSGKWSLTDYDFTKPAADLWSESETVVPLPGVESYERFEYPGGFADKQAGGARAKARMEAEEAVHDVVRGEGGCFGFQLAGKFQLIHHPFPSEEQRRYVVTRLSHHAREGSEASGADTQDVGYRNEFHCIPDGVVFRPQRLTHKPRVPGPQTAMVTGPEGEEIHTDKYGRIKVQFHWDRVGRYDETSSCWVRVAQSTAGKQWGAQVLPRVKQEVVVEFIDGDPDQPIVTGTLFNANSMPAYTLPENKTRSGLKSRSSKGAPDSAFNELRFEDKKDSEHILIKAQKDEHHWVLNDRFDNVGHDEHLEVVRNKIEKVGGDHHFTLIGDRFSKVAGREHQDLVGDRTIRVGGADSLEVMGDRLLKLEGSSGVNVTGSHMLHAGMSLHREADLNVQEKAGVNLGVEAGMEVHIKGGMNVVVEAGMQLTLKAGGSYVVIGPGGVDISGALVKVNSGGAPGAGSGANPEAPGATVAPAAPDEPEKPLEPVAAASAEAYQGDAQQAPDSEIKWTAIETAEPTQQAAALEAAADAGQPLCDT